MKHVVFAGIVALLMATPASAAVVTVGDEFSTSCYAAAAAERSDYSALEVCNTALEESFLNRHNRSATLINRGIIYLYRGQYAEALADFDAAIEADPGLAEGYTHRGVALLAHRDYRSAIEALDRGLALDPSEPAKVYFNRAIAHEELGDVAAAYHDYQRAAELAPDWSPARRELARFRVTTR
jgi:tetratricopeptide (TPR) repeat protein